MLNTVVCNAHDTEFSDSLVVFMLKKGFSLKETYINNDMRILVFAKY